MHDDPNIRDRIAAPFLSVLPEDARFILYIGKATSGEWYKHELCRYPASTSAKNSATDKIELRHECTKTFLKEEAPSYNSGFWHFARKLDSAAAEKWKSKTRMPLQHIGWTNICKIGTVQGNPEGHLFERQRSLAIETLRLEIELYKPRLICFVTWDYKFDCVKEVIGDPSDTSWDQTGNEEWIWWRPAKGKLPPILLTGHPERKARTRIEEWVAKATDILPG